MKEISILFYMVWHAVSLHRWVLFKKFNWKVHENPKHCSKLSYSFHSTSFSFLAELIFSREFYQHWNFLRDCCYTIASENSFKIWAEQQGLNKAVILKIKEIWMWRNKIYFNIIIFFTKLKVKVEYHHRFICALKCMLFEMSSLEIMFLFFYSLRMKRKK